MSATTSPLLLKGGAHGAIKSLATITMKTASALWPQRKERGEDQTMLGPITIVELHFGTFVKRIPISNTVCLKIRIISL